MAIKYRYFRVTGRGGFKWGQRLAPDSFVRTTLTDDELPKYLAPATELEYENYHRRRRGEKILEGLPQKSQAELEQGEKQTQGTGPGEDREALIQRACGFLSSPEDWTESGRPRVSAVNEVLANWGATPTTAAEIQSAAPEARRPGASGGLA